MAFYKYVVLLRKGEIKKMKETQSLRKNFQFRYVYNKGKSIANKHLVMYVVKNGKPFNQLGISVSKKVGKSVMRSHVTRLIRESYRLTEEEIKTGYGIVVIARVLANEASYHEINASLRHLLKKQGLLLSSKELEEKRKKEGHQNA